MAKPILPKIPRVIVRSAMYTGQINWPTPEKNRKYTTNDESINGILQVKVANAVIMSPWCNSCFFWYVELSPTNSNALPIVN